jgi:pheromone shutdown-related protein TraB
MIDNENVSRLEYRGKEIILIATAHVSQESVELVKRVVADEAPDNVCIELDEGRYDTIQHPDAWEKTDVVQVIKQKRVGFLMANMALSSYQRKIAKNLNAKVGGEMLQGIESAKGCGAELVLADRSIQATFMRIWRKLGFSEKCKLIFSIVFALDDDEEITDETLEEMLKQDALESVLASMKKDFPKIGQILISERDQYLANKIKNAPGPKVVAILGAAHVPGVKEEIFKEQDMDEISTVPKPSPVSKVVGWVIPAVIMGLIVYGFISNIETGLRQLSLWVLWTGTLAAGFTALSLAHPLSILTSFVVAPISTLNPVLACGWFTGLVEAGIKKPTVKDVQNVPADIFTFKGFFKNRFLKIILVVVMANIGASIGTFVAGTDMIRNLLS